MHQFRGRFTVRVMLLAVAAIALLLGLLVTCYKLVDYPHVNVTLYNESSATLHDVRIRFHYGNRTAERIEPGEIATTEIQSGGDAGVFISYRTSSGLFRKDEPLYYSEDIGGLDVGFLEVRVTNEGTRAIKQIDSNVLYNIPALTRHVSTTGQLIVKESGKGVRSH